MTDQRPATPAPAPLEAYAQQFDGRFEKLNQRHSFRRYLEGLLLPTERHKSLTGLANTEPVIGAQHRHAQALQWFLSESTWSERAVSRAPPAVAALRSAHRTHGRGGAGHR
jgi:SRSO17 transposase